MTVNWKLKKRITEICGSQSDFARVALVPEPTISKVVRGRFDLSSAEQERWALLLRCNPDEVFQAGDSK